MYIIIYYALYMTLYNIIHCIYPSQQFASPLHRHHLFVFQAMGLVFQGYVCQH